MFYPGVSFEDMLRGYRDQYLEKQGWVRSVELRQAVDANGEPVPWLTYPANAFLRGVVQPEWKVFEFGSGSSTAWWGKRVAAVHAVDHDPEWTIRTRNSCEKTVDLRLVPAYSAANGTSDPLIKSYFREVKEPAPPSDTAYQFRAGLLTQPFRAYASEIMRFPSGYFDVVIVDGMARSLCTWLTVKHARPTKFIVFDNSDREVYRHAYALLKAAGYKRIDFWGTGPINPYEWCTSLFIRDLDVLP